MSNESTVMFPMPHSGRGDNHKPEFEPVEELPEVDLTDVELLLQDPVLMHRAKKLIRAGFSTQQARNLALDRSIDVHWVISDLVERGCPLDTAYEVAI